MVFMDFEICQIDAVLNEIVTVTQKPTPYTKVRKHFISSMHGVKTNPYNPETMRYLSQVTAVVLSGLSSSKIKEMTETVHKISDEHSVFVQADSPSKPPSPKHTKKVSLMPLIWTVK